MYPESKIIEIVDYIEFAERFISNFFDRNLYINELSKLQTIEDIKYSNVLKSWESSLIFNLEGLQCLKESGEKRKNLITHLIIHPLFKDKYELINNELFDFLKVRKDISIKKFIYCFTKELAVRLYGGTPWFEPYTKICLINKVFNKKSICYQLKSNNDDCVLDLVAFKNAFRTKYPNLVVKTFFSDCKLPGKINPFHTPDSVENDNHVKAIEKVLEKEIS